MSDTNVYIPGPQRPTQADARTLLADYCAAIDDLRLSEWVAMFTDPCLYRITTRANLARGMPLSIMLCDTKAMLFDRVEAIEQANLFEPHVTRHVLSDSRVIDAKGLVLSVETSFIVVRTMVASGEMMLFAAGKYLDEVVSEGGRTMFRSKTVVLDSSLVDTLIALPL